MLYRIDEFSYNRTIRSKQPNTGRNQMNTQEKAIYAQMVAKATTLPVEELKVEILKDNANPVLPEVVFNSMMDALESIISEEDFIEFCNQL